MKLRLLMAEGRVDKHTNKQTNKNSCFENLLVPVPVFTCVVIRPVYLKTLNPAYFSIT